LNKKDENIENNIKDEKDEISNSDSYYKKQRK